MYLIIYAIIYHSVARICQNNKHKTHSYNNHQLCKRFYMVLTTQPISLFKLAIIALALILAPIALMYFTFSIESYTDLLKNIGLSISILILSASVFFMIAFKKENIQIQKPWLLSLSISCSVLFICSTMVLNNI